MRTIQDILRLSPKERASEYKAVDIDKVWIDDVCYDNYGTYSFIWEKSYVKSPERANNGSIGNLNSYSTFLTPHLKIDFSLMSIDYYRRLMQQIYGRNEFIVKCYDVIYNKKITVKMYFATEEMAKLWTIVEKVQQGADAWEEYIELVGVQGYTVELIGTNNDIDLVSVMYYPNYPSDVSQRPYPEFEAENDVYFGEDIIVGGNSTYPDNPPNGYEFAYWCTETSPNSASAIRYTNKTTLTVNPYGLTLYAIWQKRQSTRD